VPLKSEVVKLADKTLVSKLILDASSYKQGIDIAKQATASINKELELWKVKNNAASNSLKGLAQQAKANSSTQAALSAQIDITKKKMQEVTTAKGAASKEAMTYKNKLLDLQIQQAKLNKEIGGGLTPLQNFKNGLTAVSGQLKTAGEKMTSMGRSMSMYVTGSMVAATTAMVALTAKAAEYAESINILSVTTGMSTEYLQQLKYAATQVDVSFETITGSFSKFTRALTTANDSKSEMAKIFSALKVSLKETDGTLRPINETFFETIKKLGGISDETLQAEVASKIFGKSFQDLIPLIRANADEMDKYLKRAKDLNLVLSQTELDALDAMGDKFDEIKQIFAKLGSDIAVKFLPVMEKIVKIVEDRVIPAIKKFIDFVVGLVDKFLALPASTQGFIAAVFGIVAALGPLLIIAGQVAIGISGLMSMLSFLVTPAGLVIIAIAGLVAGLIYLYNTDENVRGAMDAGWKLLAVDIPKTFLPLEVWWANFWTGLYTKYLNFVNSILKLMEKIPGVAAGSISMSESKIQEYTDRFKKNFGVGAQAEVTLDYINKNPDYGKSIGTDFSNAIQKAMGDVKLPKILDGAAAGSEEAKKAAADYKKLLEEITKSADTAEKGVDTFRNSIKSMIDAIKQQTTAFANFVGLFDVFERKSVSGERLLTRLKAQVKAMGEWRSSLATLEKRGVSADLISDLRSMGAGSVDSVKALAKMSGAQLQEYQKLYNQKYSIAGGESSKMFTANQKAETVIEKQLILNVTGSKGDAEAIANTIVKKLRAAGYAF
jgi:hypothetical protein